jgi:hypothetical protein
MGLLGGHGFEFIAAFFGCMLPLLIAGIWLWGVIEVATRERVGDDDKMVWLLIVLLLPGLGTLIYYVVRRPMRMKIER